MWHLLRTRPAPRAIAADRLALFIIGLGALANTVLIMFYYWSSFNDPMAARFSLPLHLLFVFALVTAGATLRSRWPALPTILGALALLAVVLATSRFAQPLYSYTGANEIEWEKRFVSARPPGERLIITNKSTLPWLLLKTPSILMGRAGLVADRLQHQLQEANFREILVMQSFRPTTAEGDYQMVSDDRLPKGFEVELEKRRSNNWSGKLSYSYQQTRGKSSDPNEQRALQEIGGSNESRLSEEFVRWNRPRKLTVSFDVRFDNKAPRGLGWARHAGFNMYLQGQSGRAYTPLDINAVNPIGLPNSRNAPVQYTCDLKLNRWFKLADRRFDVSLAGTNVFNNHLYNRIDAITGRGLIWGQGQYDSNHVSGLNDFTHVSSVDDPSNYGPGAQWRLQLDVDL